MALVKVPEVVAKAPVTTLSAAEAIVSFVLTFLVAHHVIGTVDISADTATVAPFVALGLPVAFGAVKWALVSPWRKVRDALERDGLLSDADVARIEGLVAHYTGSPLAPEDLSAAPDHPSGEAPASANAGA